MVFINLQNPFSDFAYIMAIIFAVTFLNFCPHLLAQGGFSPALGTWYGDPDGAGSGGACGFENDVADPPYSAMISAGNAKIFQSGHGCGQCYQLLCHAEPCSGQPITVTITDECPGACNNVPYHFDLSGHAFGAMAKPGQENTLRNLGQVDIMYKRVGCSYGSTTIAFKIDKGINPYYFACAIEYISGDGDIGSMELRPANGDWIPMRQSWGEVWAADINPSMQGPLSFRITTATNGRNIEATDAVPPNWTAGAKYFSKVQF